MADIPHVDDKIGREAYRKALILKLQEQGVSVDNDLDFDSVRLLAAQQESGSLPRSPTISERRSAAASHMDAEERVAKPEINFSRKPGRPKKQKQENFDSNH